MGVLADIRRRRGAGVDDMWSSCRRRRRWPVCGMCAMGTPWVSSWASSVAAPVDAAAHAVKRSCRRRDGRNAASASCGRSRLIAPAARDVTRGKRLTQRRHVAEQLDQRAGIARDMPAVRQDLPLQFVGKPARRRGCGELLARHSRRSKAQSAPATAARRPRRRASCNADSGFRGSDRADICGKFAVGIAEHRGRLRQ